jgi:AcrR family transcriptional regulator
MVDAATYHHGDLRHALVDAGLQQARAGGPAAIGLRELTRAVGVSPNAAYRHFADRDALVRAVAHEAQQALAATIAAHISRVDATLPADERSIQTLRAVGLGYIAFARAEPGWFATAFGTHDQVATDDIVTLDDAVVAPFQLLLDTLDAMVASGALAADRRPHAEWACWASVHGFAGIASAGPLRLQPPEVVDALAAHVVDTTIRGIRGC